MPNQGRTVARRLAGLQASLFAVMGLQLPFWPLYLAAKGIGVAAIGYILAVAYVVRLVSNPLAGALTDRSGRHRAVLSWLGGLALVSTALFAVSGGALSLAAVTLVSAGAYTAMLPMADNLTLAAATRYSFAYGRVRLWGSLSFIAASSLGGLFLVDARPVMILDTVLAALAVNWLITFSLPGRPAGPPAVAPASADRLVSARFLLFVAAAALCQASHSLYYGFGTLHWQAGGLSGPLIGALWAEGVVAEVVLFAVGDRLIRRSSPLAWIAAGGAAGIIRWAITAETTSLWLLAPAQLLHALTYAAVQLGAMHHIARTVAPRQSGRAQGLYAAITAGAVPAAAMGIAGSLYGRYGGHAFFAMCALSALGLGLTLILLLDQRRRRGKAGQAGVPPGAEDRPAGSEQAIAPRSPGARPRVPGSPASREPPVGGESRAPSP